MQRDIPTPLGGIAWPTVPKARLQLVVFGPAGYAARPLPAQGSLTVGRAEDTDVCISDPILSRRHAVIHVGPTLEIEDLESANGTFVREARIPPRQRIRIVANEIVSLGSSTLIVQALSPPRRPRRLLSHGYFEERLEEECGHAERMGSTFVVMRIRIENALRAVGILDILVGALPETAILATYTPDDYEVLLLDTTKDEAEELRPRIDAELTVRGVHAFLGAVSYPHDGRSPESLVAALFAAPGRTDSDVLVRDTSMQRLYTLVERIGAGAINVLILGETGVGKEVVAKALHARSPRADRPLLRLNCAALAESLLDSELFGYEKGAFTGAQQAKLGLLETAQGGTIFLDEIGEMPLSIQAKLLRVIEDRQVRRLGGLKSIEIDARFVAATNRDLEREIAQGIFRRDLFFRLNGFTLVVPPLRERVTEIEGLAKLFLDDTCKRAGREASPTLSDEVLALLKGYAWPGNIRELKNVMERAALLCTGGTILREHVPEEKLAGMVSVRPAVPEMQLAGSQTETQLDEVVANSDDESKRKRILDALEKCGGNQTKASKLLGIPRRTLVRLLDRYEVPRPRRDAKE